MRGNYYVLPQRWNADMFPIGYVVVETEHRDSWTWFMNSLLDCISLIEEGRWVFMFDRQKVKSILIFCI